MAELTIAARHRALAEAMPMTPAAFAKLFRQIQGVTEPTEIAALRPKQQSPVDWHALAFAWAEREKLLQFLVDAIANRVLSAEFLQAAGNAGIAFEHNLQAILDANTGFIKTHLHNEKFPLSASQVCRVVVGDTPRGTGFLVKPRIVATAYHVIEPLLEAAGGGSERHPRPGSHGDLSFEFGLPIVRVAGARRSAATTVVMPTRNWLAASSPCHPLEKRGDLPEDIADLLDHYDYALIRLSSIVKLDFPGLPLETQAKLGARDEPVTIIQHPKGAPLRHLREIAARTAPPAYRVPHVVNTEKGSSGAPCLNDQYRVAGMHQAGPTNGPCTTGACGTNRCIPIDYLTDALDDLDVLDAGLMPLTQLSNGKSVIGRSQLVRWVYDTLQPTGQTPPVLVINANSAIPGRTFTVDLLRELLPSDGHTVVHMHMPDLEAKNLEGTLDKIFAQLSKPVPAIEDSLSADASQLRRAVMSKVFPELSAEDNGMTWMVLDDFDRKYLDALDGSTRDFFDALFLAVSSASRVRFIVAQRGDEFPVPRSIADAETELLGPPQGDEVEILVRRSGFFQTGGEGADLNPTFVLEAVQMMLNSFPLDKSYYRRVLEKFGSDAG